MRKSAAIALGGLFLLAGCREEGEMAREPVEIWGGRLEGLVESYGAPRLDRLDGGLIEILRSGDCWKSYDRGGFHASCSDQEELFSSLDMLRDRCRAGGFDTRLVVSAPAEIPFQEVGRAVRTAATVGICDIEFLVDQGTGLSRPSAFNLDLGMTPGCSVPSGIEPILICVDGGGEVAMGTGASRNVMDRDKTDRTLRNLDQRLSTYHHAAEAASSISIVQIYVAPGASYQRMIDVLACVEWNHIGKTYFTDIPNDTDLGCGGARELRLLPVDIPRAPSSMGQVRPLGLAPHENQLPKPPFDPELD